MGACQPDPAGLDGDGDGIACEHLPSCGSLAGHSHLSAPGVFPESTAQEQGGLETVREYRVVDEEGDAVVNAVVGGEEAGE